MADHRSDTPKFERPLSRAQRGVYWVIRTLVLMLAKPYFRIDVQGLANLPPGGAYILAPAHRSNLDAVLVQVVTPGQQRYMGKDSLWKVNGAISWLLTAVGGFPVARGTADRAALRAAQGMIERGDALVMFPEGTRQSGPTIQTLFDGPAFIASRTGVPIIPMGIGGSEAALGKGAKFPKPKRITFVIGAPILPPPEANGRVPRRAVHALTADLHTALQELFDEAQRRAGQPVGEPEAEHGA